jgi:hypothetical protein
MPQRKMPVKIEPKVFFANERTFLAWWVNGTVCVWNCVCVLLGEMENVDFGNLVCVCFFVTSERSQCSV